MLGIDISEGALAILVIAACAGLGTYLLTNAEKELAKLGRPPTDKHMRAMRLIAGGFFLVAVLTLFHWIRSIYHR